MKEYITKDRAKQFVCGHCNEVRSEEPCEPRDCDWMAFIDKEPAADVVEADRLGRVGRLMLPNKGCPRGPIGRLGMAGGKTQDKKAILIEELCCMDTFEDVDENVWRPVQEEVLQEVIEILRKEE